MVGVVRVGEWRLGAGSRRAGTGLLAVIVRADLSRSTTLRMKAVIRELEITELERKKEKGRLFRSGCPPVCRCARANPGGRLQSE